MEVHRMTVDWNWPLAKHHWAQESKKIHLQLIEWQNARHPFCLQVRQQFYNACGNYCWFDADVAPSGNEVRTRSFRSCLITVGGLLTVVMSSPSACSKTLQIYDDKLSTIYRCLCHTNYCIQNTRHVASVEQMMSFHRKNLQTFVYKPTTCSMVHACLAPCRSVTNARRGTTRAICKRMWRYVTDTGNWITDSIIDYN